jgi:hypothetical protein
MCDAADVRRVRQRSEAPATPELARRYVQRLVRDGAMDFEMAAFQLEAIEAAVRSGRPILVVEDLDRADTEQRLTHAA